MTDRKQSRGRELAINDPARPGAEGNGALDLRPRLEALFAKYEMHVAEAKRLEHCWQFRTCEARSLTFSIRALCSSKDEGRIWQVN